MPSDSIYDFLLLLLIFSHHNISDFITRNTRRERENNYMTFRCPFQPQPFFDSVILMSQETEQHSIYFMTNELQVQ